MSPRRQAGGAGRLCAAKPSLTLVFTAPSTAPTGGAHLEKFGIAAAIHGNKSSPSATRARRLP
jgi:hypothetical protein